jgi:hypothetical protein
LSIAICRDSKRISYVFLLAFLVPFVGVTLLFCGFSAIAGEKINRNTNITTEMSFKNPPDDFDEEKVKKMISEGLAPPEKWARAIYSLSISCYPDLGWNDKWFNLKPISSFINLEALSISDCADSIDLSLLKNLKNLKSLILYKAIAVEDIVSLAHLTALAHLELINTSIKNITPLSKLTKLEDLVLSGSYVSDLSPLKKLTHLKGLHINNNGKIDKSVLSHMKNLKITGDGFSCFSDEGSPYC